LPKSEVDQAKPAEIDAIERLAARLLWKTDVLDPPDAGGIREWKDLDEWEKDYFRQCIKALAQEAALWRILVD
jgi:hypothetical protein